MGDRDFFRSLTGDPRTSRFGGGGSIDNTLLPIIKIIKTKITDTTKLTNLGTFTIQHGLNKVCDFFGRCRTTGDSEWTMLQQYDLANDLDPTVPKIVYVDSITVKDITFQANNITAPLDIELYFIDFNL